MAPLWAIRDKHLATIWMSHGLIWLLGLTGIGIGWRRIRYSLAEENAAKEQLARSEERFRSLSESSPIGISQNDTDGRCLYTNLRWQSIAGLTLGESLGDGWLHAVHPDDRKIFIREWKSCILEGREYLGELRFMRPDGAIRYVRAHAVSVFSDDGESTGYVGTIADVTELKAAQEELARARKLESIGLLAGGVAHDFNNLLGVILGNINLVQMYLDNQCEAAGPLAEAAKAAGQAGTLTKQFIILATRGEPNTGPERVEELILSAAGSALSDSDIELRHFFPEDLLSVEVDGNQMSLAFFNLIVNAAEAMPQGGVMKIAANNLDVSQSRPINNTAMRLRGYVKISISDQGVGIPREHLDKIFDPYFSTKGKYNQKGIGFGLAVAQSIIVKHGGYIEVESEVNKGTIFYVTLPAFLEEGKAAARREMINDE
jgi:PAS domain S-box-containing protein